jgi:hypothetical protein
MFYRFKKEKIYIKSAQLSGDGSFIDIRYELTRPDLVNRTEKILLIDEQTKKEFYLMQIQRYGLVKTNHNKYQKSGILLFRNNDNLIKSESTVTLIFGKLKVKNIKII